MSSFESFVCLEKYGLSGCVTRTSCPETFRISAGVSARVPIKPSLAEEAERYTLGATYFGPYDLRKNHAAPSRRVRCRRGGVALTQVDQSATSGAGGERGAARARRRGRRRAAAPHCRLHP